MRNFSKIIILLVSWLSLTGASQCFPALERVPISNPSTEPLIIQSYSYEAGQITAELMKILLTEKLGLKADIAYFETFNSDLSLSVKFAESESLINGTHHMLPHIFYVDEIATAVKKHYQNGDLIDAGYIGHLEHEGFYVPDYMIDYDPSLGSYRGLQSPEVVKAFQISTFEGLPSKKAQMEAIQQELNGAATIPEYEEASNKMKDLTSSDSDFLIPFLNVFWPIQFAVKNTIDKLGFLVNITGFESFDYSNSVNKRVKEQYSKKEPFLLFWSTPNEFQHKEELAEDIKLTRISLPPVSEACRLGTVFEWQCDFEPIPIVKAYSPVLPEISTSASKLIKSLSLSNPDMSEILSYFLDEKLTAFESACKFLTVNPAFIKTQLPAIDVMDEQEKGDFSTIFMISLASLLIFLCFFSAILVIFWRHEVVVKAGSPMLTLWIIFGCALLYSGIIVAAMDVSETNCLIYYCFNYLEFFTVLGAIIFKSFRLDYLFNTKKRIKSLTNFKDRRMVFFFVAYILVVCTGLAIFTVVSDSTLEETIVSVETVSEFRDYRPLSNPVGFSVTTVAYRCSKDKVPIIFMAILQLIFLVFAIYFAIKTRKIPRCFNESRYIGLTVYTFFFCLSLYYVLIFFGNFSVEVEFIVFSVIQILAVTTCISLIVWPKLWHQVMAFFGKVDTSVLDGLGVDFDEQDKQFTQLNNMILDPQVSILLLNFATENHAGENISFLIELRDLRMLFYSKLSPLSFLQGAVDRIVETYVNDDSPKELNITSKAKKKLLSTLEKEMHRDDYSTLFDEVEAEVVLIVTRNLVKDFIKSPVMKEIMKRKEEQFNVNMALSSTGLISSGTKLTSNTSSSSSRRSSDDVDIDSESETEA